MEKNFVGLAILLVVLALFTGGLVAYAAFPKVITQEVPVEKLVLVQSSYNDTAIKADVAAVKSEIFKDADWKAAAIALANAEMEEKSYRNVFDALVVLGYDVVDKEDVSKVIVTDSEVDSFDVDEKDATVIQELKVYFEDADGETVKVYLTLTTEVVDNEVDDFEYEVA